MKNLNSRIALFILTVSTASVAISDPHRGGGASDRPARGERVAPGDGDRVARHRRSPRRAFKHMDADENGVITLDEFLAKPIEKAAGQFDRIDENDDALISFEEFSEIHDHDGDDSGDIDLDELQACVAENLGAEVPERADVEARFALIDSDADGSLDVDEFTTAKTSSATDKFNQIDEDADGALTPEELMAALQTKREHREVRRECAEGQRDVTDLLAD